MERCCNNRREYNWCRSNFSELSSSFFFTQKLGSMTNECSKAYLFFYVVWVFSSISLVAHLLGFSRGC